MTTETILSTLKNLADGSLKELYLAHAVYPQAAIELATAAVDSGYPITELRHGTTGTWVVIPTNCDSSAGRLAIGLLLDALIPSALQSRSDHIP